MTYSVETVGKHIFLERKKQGISQAQLGKKISVSGKQISNYEKGITAPPIDVLFKLCQVFNCELGFLLGEENYSNGTKLETAIQTTTGLNSESLKTIRKITGTSKGAINFGYESEAYRHIFNQMLSSKCFILLIESIYELSQHYTAYHSVDNNLETELGRTVLQEALNLYSSQIDYFNDPNAPILQPEQYTAISKVDGAIDDKYNLSYMLKIARYEVREVFETMISEMYPRIDEQ